MQREHGTKEYNWFCWKCNAWLVSGDLPPPKDELIFTDVEDAKLLLTCDERVTYNVHNA